MTKEMNTKASTKEVVLPSPGGLASVVSLSELGEAIHMAPVWLHAGWIDVIWRFRRTRIGAFWHTLSLGLSWW